MVFKENKHGTGIAFSSTVSNQTSHLEGHNPMRSTNSHAIVMITLLLTLTLSCSSGLSRDLSLTQNVQAGHSQVGSTQSAKPIPVAVLVKASEANLRDRPSITGTITNTVEKGDLLTLVNPSPVGPWYRVRANKSAPECWIHGNAIALLYTDDVTGTNSYAAERPRVTSPPSSGKSYVNVDGVRVPSPVFSDTKPAGATARCRDGSYSFSQHRRGTCSHHGGVAEWF